MILEHYAEAADEDDPEALFRILEPLYRSEVGRHERRLFNDGAEPGPPPR